MKTRKSMHSDEELLEQRKRETERLQEIVAQSFRSGKDAYLRPLNEREALQMREKQRVDKFVEGWKNAVQVMPLGGAEDGTTFMNIQSTGGDGYFDVDNVRGMDIHGLRHDMPVLSEDPLELLVDMEARQEHVRKIIDQQRQHMGLNEATFLEQINPNDSY